jgi:arylsulfatase A-like enzyme
MRLFRLAARALIPVFALMLAGSSRADAGAARPDLVVFLSDDHGQLDSTPYGATDVRTPNMQALADAGCRFTRAFAASPSCAPSRAALLTGLYPARNGAEANHTYKKDGVASLPEVLRTLGYETAAFGKVAHGPTDVARHGFDHHEPRPDLKRLAAFLARRDRGKPLCLFFGTNEPHVPWAASEGYDPDQVQLPPTFLDTPETRESRCRYYTDVTRADAELGAVRRLAREVLGEDAVFVYTSDHGAQWPFGKWNLYDAGIAVPLLVEWPGVVTPGTTSDALVQSIDLLPTLIDVAGGTPPDAIDGRSFADVLRGKTRTHRERIFATHTRAGTLNDYPIRAVRTARFKYIRNLHPEREHTTPIDRANDEDGRFYFTSWVDAGTFDSQADVTVARYHRRPAEELYDVTADPHERINLAGDTRHAATLRSLRAELDAWMKSQGEDPAEAGGAQLSR